MRIAVVSDIHANILAFDAFKAFLESNPDITTVLNAGDMINVGPYPHETAEEVLDHPKFVSIMGNNEEMLTNAATSDGGTNRHRRWTFARVPTDTRERLSRLPTEWSGEINGVSFFMTHSRPGNSNVFPLIYDKHDIHGFARDYESVNAQVIIFGHTHEPMCVRHHGRLFLNPGALGLGHHGRGRFAILTIDNDHIDVDFRSIAFDTARLTMDYFSRDVPDKEYIMEHFFGINSMVSL